MSNNVLALLAALAESSKVSDPKPTVDLRSLLHAKQLNAINDTGRTKAILAGRRSGKTVLAAVFLLEGALNPGALCVYLALTSKSARYIVWPALKQVARDSGIGAEFNEHTLTVTIPGGGTIVVAGTDDQRTIETWRGTKLTRAVVDECGSQPDFLGYLYRDILKPACLDLRGELMFLGTPSPLMQGFWYEMSGPHREMGVPVFSWDVRDNPWIPDAEDALREIREEHGWSEDSPTYRREYLAEWCDDPGSLVYPWDREKNGIDELPILTPRGWQVPEHDWRWVIGVDVGVVDATAMVVTGANRVLSNEYVVHSEAHGGLLVREVEERIRDLKAFYPSATVVLDSGGLGKVHANEFSRWSGLGFLAAKKTEKASQIRLTRDRLIAGRIKLLNGPELDPLRREWAALGWDKQKLHHDPNGDDHASDACLYSLRELRHYTHNEYRARRVDPLSIEAWEEAEDREMARIERQRRRYANQSVWDA